MRIKRVDISGFKSFCDPTQVVFDHSVTAVVGPNGCGKSNIVDAVRWTLGERNAKNLRGKSMEDIIFNGSENRGPQSMAEVTITFDNTDGLSHSTYTDYPEIAVTRRLHRNGTSEYLINKVPCRLMDVTDLFLGTGGGARAYSIIEQGRIGLIVSARSEDRRGMIEEAAGITKYKKARTAAERRMDQTRQNLLRVTDVISVMERTLASLKRQAQKAERFKSYRKEQTDLELYVSCHRFLELRAKKMTLEASFSTADQERSNKIDAYAALETQVETLRLTEHEAKRRLDDETQKAYEINKEIQVLENEIRHLTGAISRLKNEENGAAELKDTALKQRAELEDEGNLLDEQVKRIEHGSMATKERLEELTERCNVSRQKLQQLGQIHEERRDLASSHKAKLATAESSVQNLSQRIVEAEDRLINAREERASLEHQAEELATKVIALEEQLGVVEERVQLAQATEMREREAHERLSHEAEECDIERRRLQGELQSKESRKTSLEEVISGLQGHDDSVREAMILAKRDGTRGLRGLLVDRIRCPERYELALAAALRDRLQALLLDDRNTGIELMNKLNQQDMGRISILSKDLIPRSLTTLENVDDQAIHGTLMELIELDDYVKDMVHGLLPNLFVTNTLDDAERLWKKHEGKAGFVTLDGQILEAGGEMRGGSKSTPGASLLGQQRQIRELATEIEEVRARFNHVEERFAYLSEEKQARAQAAETARREMQDQQIVLAEVRKDKTRAAEDLAAMRNRFDGLDAEVIHQEEMLYQARQDRDEAITVAQTTRHEIDNLEHALAEQAAQIEVARHEVEHLTGTVSDIRVQQASLEQQRQSALGRKEQLNRSFQDLESRLARAERRRVDNYSELGTTAGDLFRQKELLEIQIGQATSLEKALSAQREQLQNAANILAESEAELKRRRGETDKLKEQISELQMNLQKSELAIDHLLETVVERNDLDLLRVLGDYHLRPLPTQETILRGDELKGLIDRMGPINLAAIEEFDLENTKYEELSSQKNDLEQALEDLERAIAKMDKDSRQRFKETFEDVNRRFKELFPKMFNGGHAELLLTDSGDMLRTGVDIVAQPPGKRPSTIELLSGGEKALTAVSLLFAIFLHRPSPFCVLDEVDAPLDEANIGRFIDMVKKMTDRSQFIIITHSKLTMERSDALYGVTMQEPGVSKLVSVRLTDTAEKAEPAATA